MSEGLDYVGVKPCGCVVAAASFRMSQAHPRDFAMEIAGWLRDGLQIERRTADEVRSQFGACQHEAMAVCGPCAEYHERGRDETGLHCVCGKPKFRNAVACDQCLGHEKGGAK